jgi:hypothetical protein
MTGHASRVKTAAFNSSQKSLDAQSTHRDQYQNEMHDVAIEGY